MKTIFITGGAGYIGSHCVVSLVKNGFTPIIIDNFSNSKENTIKNIELIIGQKIIFYKIDLRDKKKLKSIFKKHKCYCVIHCAGLKAIGESVKEPITYIEHNVGSTLSLLDCMMQEGVYKIIFSSSASVYDTKQTPPWKEQDKIGNTNNPYSNSKFIIEKILEDVAKFDNKWSIRIARYFNPISNHFSGLIRENPRGIPNNLFPLIINVAQKKNI